MRTHRSMLAAGACVVLAVAYQRLTVAARPAPQAPDPAVVWQIGRADGLADEFARGAAADGLLYEAGSSTPGEQWRETQEGREENPAAYTVNFSLDTAEGGYVLAADVYFVSRAPRAMVVTLNGRRGYFALSPAQAENHDERQSNTVLHSAARLRAPLPRAHLRQGRNSLGVAFLGAGSVSWDALALRRDAAGLAAARLVPALFYKKHPGDGRLVELADLVVGFQEALGGKTAAVEVGPHRLQVALDSRGYDFGQLPFRVEVPAVEGPSPLVIRVPGAAEVRGTFVPEKRWRLFAGLKIHNDIGYTDIQPHIQELDNRNTDGVMDLVSRLPFYKFNFETSWLAENYLQSREPAQTRRFLAAAAQGRVGVSVLYLNLMTGMTTGEELYRALYYSHALHLRHGIPFQFACLTDAPSHSWFLPTLLAGVGVKGFSLGSNQTRAPLLQNSTLNEDSPFWWEGADGSRLLSWYARSYLQFHRLLAMRPSEQEGTAAVLESTIPQFLARYRRADYPADAVLVYGLYTDNAEIGHGEARLIDEWNRAYEFPKIVAALDSDYYDYITKNFGSKLPVRRGDGGAYWEDGAGSTARETAVNRRTQAILPAAEMAAAMATALDSRQRYPADEFREAWKNLMFYDEHTWGANNSVAQPDKDFVTRQWEVKQSFAWRAHWAAKDLLTRSLNRLVQHIGRDGRMLYVFNPDVWPRTDVIEAELNAGQSLVDPASGREVDGAVIAERDGYRVVRFLARDVPALGYRTYSMRQQPPAVKPAAAESPATVAESRYYRVELDPVTGVIRSVRDKTLGRELVDTAAPYGLNQMLYVSGGERSRILQDVSTLPQPALVIAPPERCRRIEKTVTPYGQRLVVTTAGPHIASLETEITVYDELARVDIANRLRKDEVRAKEAVYFAFPFRVSPPELLYQVQNGFVRAEHDQLPGAAREWFTTQNLVVARDGGVTIAWATPDAPLVTLTDINRGRWLKHLDVRNGHVFSYAMNNYWFTNYKAGQGGEFTFRYSFTSGAQLSGEQLARFDAAARSGLIAYPYYDSANVSFARREGKLPMAGGTLFQVQSGHARLAALKAAEDGAGVVLRLAETSGQGGTARVGGFPFAVRSAWLANGVEQNQRSLAVRDGWIEAPLLPYQYTTVRLQAAP